MECLWPAGIPADAAAVAHAAVTNAAAHAAAAAAAVADAAALAVGQHRVGRLPLLFSANSQW